MQRKLWNVIEANRNGVVTHISGVKMHYCNSLLHRTDGKAVEHVDGSGEYWVMGKFYEEKEFLALSK